MTIQRIYNDYGKYDKVVVVTFLSGSISEQSFGNQLTGQFYYTQGDRLKLEQGTYVIESNPIKLRFQIILREGLTAELIDQALHKGIRLDDIHDIFTLPKNGINEFIQNAERSLPNPIVVEFDGRDNMDLVMLGFYGKRLADGEELLDYEKDRYAALTMIYKPNEIDNDFEKKFINSDFGDPKKSVLYEKCVIEFDSGHVDEITEEHQSLIEWKCDKVNQLVRRELRKVGIASNKELAQFLWLYNFLLERGVQYAPEILKFGNPLIYMDYESWMHIFLKHTKPLMVGKHVKSRTPFQYALKDIFMLLKHLISQIERDIETHFNTKGQVEFTKRNIYFQGDYYTVKISAFGRIETIYKQNKPSLTMADHDHSS